MKTFIIVFFLLLSSQVFAQQDPLYSQYMLNPLIINPAYAGINNNFNAMAGYRTQWTGLDGHPTTLNASAHTSVANNKVGVGILFVNDRIGSVANAETNISVSYKLELQENIFSFGMQAGVQSFRSDNSGLNIFDPDDNAFSTNERGTRLNIGAGAILKSERFFVGLSVPRLLPSRFSNGGQEFELYNQHYYLMGGYVHYLNEHIRFKPSVMFRGVKGAPPSVDVAFNLNINAIHNAGIFTRNLNTYGILLQTLVKEKLRFGYVFELPTNKSVGAQFTSHEFSVGISMAALSFHEKSLSNF
jgi:type IX secretion system PorP/SprF family membrane protein